MTHSPAPWAVRPIGNHVYIFARPPESDQDFAYATKGDLVAYMPKWLSAEKQAEQDANIQLLMAAPDLLCACKMAEATLADIDAAHRKGYITEAKKQLRAALKRVEACQ